MENAVRYYVEESTVTVWEKSLERMSNQFQSIPLRSIPIEDAQQSRT